MSAIGISGPQRPFVISATGYNHTQLVFERQQSLGLRGMEWEGRIRPLTPWSAIIARGAGVLALCIAAAVMFIH